MKTPEQILEIVFEYLWYNGAYLVIIDNYNGMYVEDVTCIARNEI